MPELKRGWNTVKFGDVVRLSKERSSNPLADGIERYVGLEHINPDDLRVRTWGEVADGTTFTSRFRPGQVLFGKRRAYQRKVAVADFEGVCSGDIYVLESADAGRLLPELLPFICQTDAFFEHAVGTSAGSLSPRTNWASLAKYEFALPPILEQSRTLVQLRTLHSHIDSLRVLERSLEAWRDSLIEWCATAGEKNLAPDGSVPRERLPQGWRSVSISELCANVRGSLSIGPFGSDLVASDYQHTEGIPVIFVGDVVRHRFDYSSARYVTVAKAERLRAHEAVGGDVLVTKMGWPPGEACVVPPEFVRAIITADVIRVRPDRDAVVPEYLSGILNSHWGRQQIVRISPGTTRPKMTLRDFGMIRLALPPLDMQRKVGECLVSLQTQLSGTEGRIKSAMTLMRKLGASLFES